MVIPRPPILSGQQELPNLAEFYMDSQFATIDQYHRGDSLEVGSLITADNLYNVGGVLLIRPGKQAVLSAALGAPVYMLGTMQDGSRNTWILFSSGSTTGKLYKIQSGTSAYTEIKYGDGSSVALANGGANAVGVVFGSFFYLIDGSADGSLLKTDLDTAFQVTALDAPTVVPVATAIASGYLPGFWPSSANYDAPPNYIYGLEMARAHVTVVGGVITALTLDYAGLYASAVTPTLMFIDPTGAGSGASATVTMGAPNADGTAAVSGFTGLAGGASYSTQTIVAFVVDAPNLSNAFPNTWKELNGSHSWAEDTNSWTTTAVTVYGKGGNGTAGGDCSTLIWRPPLGSSSGGANGYDWDIDGNPIQWANLYDPTSLMVLKNAIPNVQHADGSGEWAQQFSFAFRYFQMNIHASLEVTVTANLASGGSLNQSALVAPPAQTPKNITDYPVIALLFDFFDEVAASDFILDWGVTIQLISGTGKTLGNSQGILIGYFTGGPGWGNLATQAGGFVNGGYTTQQYSLQRVVDGWNADTQTADAITFPAVNNWTKDARLKIVFGTGANVTVGAPSGGVLPTGAATVSSGGAGYLNGTVVAFVGGGGSGAAGTVTIVNGVITAVNVTNGGTGYTSAPTLVFGLSFTSNEFVSVPLKGFTINGILEYAIPGDSLVLRVLSSGQTAFQGVPLVIDPTGTFASADLTALDPSLLACILAAEIQFIDNPVVSAAAFSFNIGQFTIAGNLSANTDGTSFASYTWVYTEVDSNGDATLVLIIQSDPSPESTPALAITSQFATAQLQLPDSPLNAASDRFFLYRQGGTMPNGGQYTLVASATWAESFAMGEQPATDEVPGLQRNPNPYVSWGDPNNPAAPTGFKYFVDNTPDAVLNDNPLLVTGREVAPVGATAIALFQNRLWLAYGGNIISSWLKSATSDAGDYFNQVLDPSDSNAAIKGIGVTPVGNNDNDPVAGFAVLGNVLTVWKGLASYFVAGSDPTDFSCNAYTAYVGQGLVAPKAITTADNVIYLLMQDGVYTFDGQQLQKVSDPIGPSLTPVLNEDGGAISAAAYSNIAFTFHGGRLMVFAPDVGGSVNSVAHIFDTRFASQASSGWVGRWKQMNVTSAVGIGSATQTPDLWLGGADGMIYRLTGNGDTATSGGSATAVPWALTTRYYGRPPEGLTIWLQSRYNLPLGIEDKAWLPWFMKARIIAMAIDMNSFDNAGTAQATTASVGVVYADTGTQKNRTVAFTGRLGNKRYRVPPDRGGIGIAIQASGSTANNLQIIGCGVTLARGAMVN